MRNKGVYAQHFHITPEQGLLNDPNGLCYFDGYYHVFYQYNPYKTDHSVKYWGHVRSKDMKHWEQLPVALKSNDWFDKDGVYSGGAVVHEGTMYLFYTGNTKDANGVRTSYQCLATSTDGIHFEKKGPILTQAEGFTGHVRDPKVWRDDEMNGWWMILGAQRTDRTGDTIAYFSKDLLNWEYRDSILQFDEPYGYMWECPDMVFLTDEVTGEEKAVFIFSPQGIEAEGNTFNNIFNTTYLVGSWDNRAGKFLPDLNAELIECDRGFEYYAPQSFEAPDGRVIQYAWQGTMWPEVEEAVPTHQDNWIHQLSFPKSLHLKNGKLIQRPVAEQLALVDTASTSRLIWSENEVASFDLVGPTRVTLHAKTNMLDSFTWTIDQEVMLSYDLAKKLFTIQRTNWLTKEQEQRAVELEKVLTNLDVWIDSSSIELLINDGSEVFSLRYFAENPLSNLTINTTQNPSELEIELSKLQAYQFDY